jgi:AMMECR1 domain-containing protein
MDAGSSKSTSLEVMAPEDIEITRHHVSYAFAVLSERVTGAHQNPNFDFKDARCPGGKAYHVIIAWEKPRVPDDGLGTVTITMACTKPSRTCRGCTMATSETLASAIRKAALEIDPDFAEIAPDEVSTLTCKLHLLHNLKKLSDDNMMQGWRSDLHGLAVVESEPLSKIKQEGCPTPGVGLFLNEVPMHFNSPAYATLVMLLRKVGYPIDRSSNAPLVDLQAYLKKNGCTSGDAVRVCTEELKIRILSFRSSFSCGDWVHHVPWVEEAGMPQEGLSWQSVEQFGCTNAPAPMLPSTRPAGLVEGSYVSPDVSQHEDAPPLTVEVETDFVVVAKPIVTIDPFGDLDDEDEDEYEQAKRYSL